MHEVARLESPWISDSMTPRGRSAVALWSGSSYASPGSVLKEKKAQRDAAEKSVRKCSKEYSAHVAAIKSYKVNSLCGHSVAVLTWLLPCGYTVVVGSWSVHVAEEVHPRWSEETGGQAKYGAGTRHLKGQPKGRV